MSASETRPGPLQPWLHGLVVSVDGNTTALSSASGDITGAGAEGLFVDDARALSLLTVALGDHPLVPVGQASSGARSEFICAARHLGDHGPDPTVEVRRVRLVRPSALVETVSVTSSAATEVQAVLVVVVGGDGAEVNAVKAGRSAVVLPVLAAADGVLRWESARHRTEVRVATPEGALASVMVGEPGAGGTVTVPIAVPADGSVEVSIGVRVERTAPSLFDAGSGSALVDWAESVSVECADPRLSRLVEASLDDLQHLLLTDPADPSDLFAGAGTPWYLTLFGRDALWAARLALPFGTTLAAGTLRALARRQGRVDDPQLAEGPGKIPHELRRVASPAAGRGLPPVYYGTVDATALWVCLLHDAWRWGMPELEVRALLPNLRSAVGWLRRQSAAAEDGLLRYVDESGAGLVNQGWKDSGDSIRWRDGTIAETPIALVEAQAYAVEAATAARALLLTIGDAEGDAALAGELAAYGQELAERLRKHYWVESGADRWLAMAVDGRGRAVDGLGSNMGHVLGTGALTTDEARSVARTLMEPRMLGRHGIVTYARDNGGFNPLGYHTGSVWTHDTAICAWGMAREGFGAEASEVARRLLDAGESFGYRFPELFSDAGVLGQPVPYPAACRPQAWSAASAVTLLTVALGLSVDVPRRTLTVHPPRPLTFGAMTLRGIRVGEAVVTVRVSADGSVDVEGLPTGFTLVADTSLDGRKPLS